MKASCDRVKESQLRQNQLTISLFNTQLLISYKITDGNSAAVCW